MAHEFLIVHASSKPKPGGPFEQLAAMQRGPHGLFQGFAEGALYTAFDAQEFNAGPSGCFGGKTISQREAAAGMCAALEALKTYIDPRRADSLKAFYRDHIENQKQDAQFYVHFY